MNQHPDAPDLVMTAERWRALNEELDRVLELPDSELQAWLGSLQARDAARGAWMRRLLAARKSPAFAGFLQESASALARDYPHATLVGSRVGAYVVDVEIGRGGMGSVWRAHRADGNFEGTVALKFLHAYFLGSAGEQRFRAEGRLLARLDHPNIARLIDAGVFEGRDPYLVLEYVEGEPIDTYCERHALGLQTRIRLFLDVLAAIVHAHGHLIVHRDIKPSNILVAADGKVKLLDFGIAKLLHDEQGLGALSQTRSLALTPLYAAPEQLLGQPITTATDVYSLALVLFQLLTGRQAVARTNGTSGEVLNALLTEDPQRASAVASLAGIPARALAGDIDNILGKALKKDPSERYSTAQAFADDLRHYLADEPVAARADSLAYRTRKLFRRRRGAVLTAAAVAITLVATSGAALWQAHRAGRERDAALLQARRADSVGDFMSTLLGDFSRSGTPQAQRAYLDRARQLLAQQHYTDPLLRANLLGYLSGRYAEFGYSDTAIELLQQAKGLLASPDNQIARAQVGCELANIFDDLGEEASAEREINTAMQTLESLGTSVRPQVRADCREIQSYVATALGRNKAAVAAAQRSLDELEAAGLHSGLEHVTALNALARAHARAGDNAIAVSLLRQLRTSAAETDSPRTIGAWIHQFNEASDLFAGGKVREAERLSAALIAAGRGSAHGSRDLTALRAQVLIALNQGAAAADSLHRVADRMSPAKQQLQWALLEIEGRLLAGDEDAARRLWSRSEVAGTRAIARGGAEAIAVLRTEALLKLKADPAGADQLLARAAALAVDADGEATPARRTIDALRAQAAFERGAPEIACRMANSVLSLAEREAVDRSSSAWIGEGLLLAARCSEALGDVPKSRSSARAALQHLEENLGTEHPDTVLAHTLASSPPSSQPRG